MNKLLLLPKRGFATAVAHSHPTNAKVWMSVNKGDEYLGKMEFELFNQESPKTAENFRSLCSGDNEQSLSYQGSNFSKVIDGFMALGGKVENGASCKSIFGSRFEDENLKLRHDSRGLLSMWNSGPNTNGS